MKPIVFSTESVRAILDGRKTQTRRVMKPQPHDAPEGSYIDPYNFDTTRFTMWTHDNRMCLGCGGSIKGAAHWEPKYQPGDTLWVRETWYYEEHMHEYTNGAPDLPSGRYLHRYIYRESSPDYPVDVGVGKHGWSPSTHMPREAARIFLRVTGVRVERLQEISEDDAIAEGGTWHWGPFVSADEIESPSEQYARIWDSINSKRGGGSYAWDKNPFCWVISFQRITKEEL